MGTPYDFYGTRGIMTFVVGFALYSVGVVAGLLLGFFIGVRAEATQGTFHDSYLTRGRRRRK